MLPLTKRQREILDYLTEFIQQNGYAPSLEEIGRRFGLSSLATVHKHLTNLQEKGFIKELRADGKISLSLQPVGQQARDELSEQILTALRDAGGSLALSDKSSPEAISKAFGVSKGNFKKAIGGLFKQGLIRILDDRIELV